jgi:hypothetical protein
MKEVNIYSSRDSQIVQQDIAFGLLRASRTAMMSVGKQIIVDDRK